MISNVSLEDYMNFADYQKEIIDQIYHLLIDDDNMKVISLYGDNGCGKSTIALGVLDLLQEGWAIFFIEGIDQNITPYLTWHVGTKIYSKKKLDLGSEISFGVNSFSHPLSMELGITAQYSKTNFLLTPNEEALIAGIKKQSVGNNNILIVADNYELWDIPSKQFLQKLMLPQLNLLDNAHVVALLISSSKIVSDINIMWTDIPVCEIPEDNIYSILRQKGYHGQINIKDIKACAGNDLSLAIMAADYYDGNSLDQNFNMIMEKRRKSLSPQDQEACKVLEPLSIIDSYFTKDETAFFINPDTSDPDETEYLAEEYLSLAEQQRFIVGKGNYHFVNNRIRSYFKSQLSKKERYLHRKFSSYLQKYHPEDYYNRGKHLSLSIQTDDTRAIIEAWQLLFLAYIRRAAEVGKMDDIYNILNQITSLIDQLKAGLIDNQRHTLNEFMKGYQEFSRYNYKKAIIHLQAITPSRLVSATLAEWKRLLLLCHVQLAENPNMIEQIAEELYEIISASDFYEPEQYCRAALVLLDVYIDRLNDGQKVKILKKNFIQNIQRYIGNTVFEEFEACYNRKAALYYSAVIASLQTEQSIDFYRKHHNYDGLYMALCNHLGNSIISGNYNAAQQALLECDSILKANDGRYFPSRYKLENNRILLDFLMKEKKYKDDPKQYMAIVKDTVTALSKIMDKQTDEVSYVVLFNYLGLSMLCGTTNIEKELTDVSKELYNIDGYYQYFLHDLLFAYALLRGDITEAAKQLNVLKSLNVPLLYEYKKIFIKRQNAQENLLCTPFRYNGDPLKYHIAISSACTHVQDSSCYFWGRGFLLSDLQFLSF